MGGEADGVNGIIFSTLSLRGGWRDVNVSRNALNHKGVIFHKTHQYFDVSSFTTVVITVLEGKSVVNVKLSCTSIVCKWFVIHRGRKTHQHIEHGR